MLNGFDNLYMPTKESDIMAGKRPSFDYHISRALLYWHLEQGTRPFTSKELMAFMFEMHIDKVTQSQVVRMTPTAVASRLAFWAKAGKVEGLELLERNPHRYRMVLE